MSTCVKMSTTSEEHFTFAMQIVTSTSLTMVLMNVIKLHVLEVIAEAGPDTQLSAHEITSHLSIPNQYARDKLDRMLRVLASHSIVTCAQREHESKMERVYGLTPVAKYFIPNEDGGSLGPLMELLQHKMLNNNWFTLKDCVVEGGVPCKKVYGGDIFEYITSDDKLNEVYNNSMVNHSILVVKEILKCYNGFIKLKSLVDVGGGLGVTLNMILSKYPFIKGINYDQPNVIRHAPLYPGVEHVGGDMFHDVPQGDAIFMKWILHDWSDDSCVKLLKNCYKALPDDGKVIVVDTILPFVPDTSCSTKVNTNIDAIMMAHYAEGKERTKDEFLVLAKDAGFSGVKTECFVYNLWVMEFYK